MLGYRYALSPAGHFLGFTVLGRFFLENNGLRRADVQANAGQHFAGVANMVRPVLSGGTESKGTAEDGFLYICTTCAQIRWALLVHIRTGDYLHAVLVPTFDDAQGIEQFLTFLKSDEEVIDAVPAMFQHGKWLLGKESRQLQWPKPAGLW
jgi:hypothetical protein